MDHNGGDCVPRRQSLPLPKALVIFLEPAAAQWADTDRMRHDFSACILILSSWPLFFCTYLGF